MSGAGDDFFETAEEMVERCSGQDKERANQQGKAVKRAGAADGADDPDDDAGTIREGDGKQPKQADILIGLAKAATLFHTPAPDSDAFADIKVGGHRETHRVRSKTISTLPVLILAGIASKFRFSACVNKMMPDAAIRGANIFMQHQLATIRDVRDLRE